MGHENHPNYLHASKGLKNWLVTLDHKRIGLMYLCGILAALLLGGAFALLVRIELLTPGLTIIGQDRYNSFFTLHGAVMVFLVIVPGIPAALGNFVLPMQLGAPDVAFPRLNLASFYLWCIGAALLLLSVILGGVDAGWTFYTPYSLSDAQNVIPAVLGVFILGFSSIFTGVNFVTTVHKFRPRGMGWFKMPLNVWALYSTAIVQVLATPVLGITVLLLFVEKFAGIGIFDPNLGGDPVVFQHFFWFYSHPAVYIMIIPAMGVMSELISTFARKPIFGYSFIAVSSISLALLSFLVWGHHLFVSGQSRLATMIFSALTFSVGIPSAIKVFNWVATLYKGAISLKTPMLYALAFILLFTIGGLTGLFLGILSVDVHLHDTYFVVAHFHYVMMGSTLIAFIGALHYWFPKISGRMYPEKLGQVIAVIVFFSFNLTFLPQFVMGSRGMPRRYWEYDDHFAIYHQLSTVGALIMGLALFTVVIYLAHAFFKGKKAPANPWGSSTLEWAQSSPPPLYNFLKAPKLRPLYEYDDLALVSEEEGYVYKDDTASSQLTSSNTPSEMPTAESTGQKEVVRGEEAAAAFDDPDQTKVATVEQKAAQTAAASDFDEEKTTVKNGTEFDDDEVTKIDEHLEDK